MGIESFNSEPPDSESNIEPEIEITSTIRSDQKEKIEQKEEISEEMRILINKNLESLSNSLDRLSRILKRREEDRLNEFYPQDLGGKIRFFANAISEGKILSSQDLGRVEKILKDLDISISEYGKINPRGGLKEDPENLRHLGSIFREISENMRSFRSHLNNTEKPELERLIGVVSKLGFDFEEAMKITGRRFQATSRYLNR